MAALLGACGGGSSQDSNEAAGTYRLRVAKVAFPTKQDLGETSLLRLAIRNSGRETVPNLNVMISVGGRLGSDSSLPFGIRDPQPGLAQPDRPVWVLASHYPKLDGSEDPGGATTSNPKTFALGPLEPGKTTEAVWKLSAVKAGHFTVLYRVGAGLAPDIHAKTAGGVAPGGSIKVEVSSEPPQTEVTPSGDVVEIERPRRR